ncbi:MAG TPA: PLP-dependent aminotransferase family protein [Gemmatimonadaceae bacterium]|nr:PLP-dependent aminotransferase family protein [Gemmatimonadaceae bacterium]
MTTSRAKPRVKTSAGPDILAHLPLERGARIPLHRQIYDGIRGAILAGSIRAGQRVPSTRTLAVELHVSRLSVLTAYDQLLHEGYLEGRVGSGTFVSAALPDDAMRSVPWPRRNAASPSIQRPTHATSEKRAGLKQHEKRRSDGGLRPFRVSLPALDAFPHAAWARLVARHARAMSPAQMAYGNPAGLGVLRSAIAEHLRTARAVRCEAEQVLIVSGSQAALRICAAVLLKRGESVAVEEPGYAGARAALATSGADVAPIAVDDDGIDVGALAALRRRPRAVYVTPSHQYPLGASMSATRRLALLDWADRQGAWIIEDDYDSEYRYVSRPLGALQGMDAHGRVVYVGTFSKVLFPALRIGYLVVPPTLWTEFMDAREAFDLFSPTLYQLALADFLREGHFARHLRRMRTRYLSRRKALLAGLNRHCAGLLTIHNADAGLHIATLLPPDVDDVAVVNRMTERGLAATALSTCYAESKRRSGLLLGFGGSNERRIAEATGILGEVLREFRGRAKPRAASGDGK